MNHRPNFDRFELPAVIAEGTRNDTLYRYACSLWGRTDHPDPDALLEELARANAERCTPPLSLEELKQIRDSVTSRPAGPSPEYLSRAPRAAGRKIRVSARGEDRPPEPNDVCVGGAFARANSDCLRAVHEGGKFRWFAYDGVKWAKEGEPIAANLLSNYITALVDLDERAADTEAGADGKKRRRNRYEAYLSANKRRALLADVANRPELCATAEDFDQDTNLLNVRNGTIELDPFRFREHRAADMCTRVAGAEYNPDASQAAWTLFLDGAFEGDTADVLPFLKVSAGLAIAGDTSPERFYALYGEPRAGKSTFADALGAALGDYAHTSSPNTFAVSKRSAQGPAADYIAMEGARLLLCNEWPKDRKLDAAFLKSLTGNDPITARGVFGRDERNINPNATLMINTNYLPDTNDETLFTSGRAVVVPFTNSRPPEQQDRGLKNRLREPEALSGVLNWLLDGYRIYAGTRRIPEVPASCVGASGRYALESDNVARFVNDECEAGEQCADDGPLLYQRYRDYCEDAGEGPASAQAFYKSLSAKGYRVSEGREWFGNRQASRVVHGLRYSMGNQ